MVLQLSIDSISESTITLPTGRSVFNRRICRIGLCRGPVGGACQLSEEIETPMDSLHSGRFDLMEIGFKVFAKLLD